MARPSGSEMRSCAMITNFDDFARFGCINVDCKREIIPVAFSVPFRRQAL